MAIIRSGKLIGVCVHHSAVKPGAENITELKQRANSYNTTHSKKTWAETIKTPAEYGYPYIEYHYMIAKDGSLLQVQDEKYVLYHAGDNFRGDKSFNLHGIAVCLTGNYETDKPTDAQMLTLVKFIRDVQKRYKIDAMVRGHKETSQTATACPGKNIGTSSSGWLKKVIENVNNSAYPPVALSQPSELTEYQKEVERLKSENEEYKKALETAKEEKKKLEAELQLKNDRVEFLEQTLKEREEELVSFDAVKEERDRLQAEKLALQEEISKLENKIENNLVKKITDFLGGLLRK